MSENLGDTNVECFPLVFETNDDQYQLNASIENSAENLLHEASTDTSPVGGDAESDWFNIGNLTLENGPNNLPHPSPKGVQRRRGAEEDWFVVSDTYTSGTSFDGGHHTPDSSILDMAILSTRNGNSHRFMTTLSDFTSILADMGVDGPKHLVGGNLDRVGTIIGKGAQFTVFVDHTHEDTVLKRVNHYNAPASLSKSQQTFAHFRTLELEILALCHPPLREHRNIVDLISWGYDYQTPELLLPVLFMERALTSLSNFLRGDNMASVPGHLEINIRHHMCLDIADGLEALHNEGIVHGDVKPDNVLVFRQDNPRVPYLGKLSDFGICISIENPASLSFASYRGTPGWAPPEAGVYDKDIHGDFSPELLSRCDGFSYCLVVLSILLTRGRPPFQFEQVEGQEDEESPCEKAMGLIWGHEDRKFPKSLRSKLLSLCRAMLGVKPQDRVNISSKLLADDSKGYNDWIATRETTTKQNGKRTHIIGRKTNETNKGVLYWIGFQSLELLKQLEKDYQDTKKDNGPRFSGETLFGMAIAFVSSTPGINLGFRRAIEYMSEAAKGSCIPAQAIIKRLYEAQELSISAIADKQLLETWLFNSVSTGSLVATEDLAELNPALLLEARVVFRKAGGYNAEASHQTAHRFSSLDIDMARLMCEGGVESLQDLNGNKALHFAAMFDKPEVIKYLVEERRAAVNSKNDRGETPLHKACLAGHHAAVEMLISLGADASIASTPYEISPLHWLFNFEEQHIDKMAQLLVSKGKADVGAIVCKNVSVTEEPTHPPFIHFPFHWPFGTPLHWAASTRCTTAIDSLLKLGADINARDSKIYPAAHTALAMAARRGDSKIVQYLLNKGASATAVSDQGHNAFHTMALTYTGCSQFYKFWEGFDAWIYNGTYENNLAKVRECVLALLRAGCDLDRRRSGPHGKLGDTPLLDASIAQNCVVSLALLEAGANVNFENSSHELPIHLWAPIDDKSLAYPQGFMALFQQLVDRMEDINIKAGFLEETIPHYVVKSSKTLEKSKFEERIRFLVTHDPPADINALDKRGTTPLQLAISSRHPGQPVELSGILLQYGARVHYGADRDFLFILSYNPILTDAETTYLLKRLLEGYSDAEKLQMANSSVTRVFGKEYSAFFAAIKLGKFECVKYLLELGMDPNTITGGRITSLDWALTSGEQIRRSYLETLADYFTRDERDAASERGAAFGLRFRNDDTVFGDEGISRDTYFGITKIIPHLVSMGAKQARHIVKDGYRSSNPNRWDDEFTGYSDGWFTVETQPFYEHWKLSYKLRSS